MPDYPIDSDKLLAAAELLAPARASRGRPPYTAHRRAVSTGQADAFVELYARRQQADYDHAAVFGRRDTRAFMALAAQVIPRIETIDTDASRLFFALVAMQSRIQSR